jgi:predicted DNA-binding transcriptional regulator AlpA
LDQRLAKLLLIAFDDRSSTCERIAALGAASRLVHPQALRDTLVAAASRAQSNQGFSFSFEQQLELLQSNLAAKEAELARAKAEIEQLKKQRSDGLEEGLALEMIIAITGLSRATLYRRMSAGTFPRPCSAKGTRKLWDRSELQAWQLDGNSA